MTDKPRALIPIGRTAEPAIGTDFNDLPELLAEIADVVGREAALDIAYVRGGRRTHFPARADDNHWLVKTVGREAADSLCKHFCVNHTGGIMLTMPLGETSFYKQARKRAIELRLEGHSIATTARKLGVTTRSVEVWWAAWNKLAERVQESAQTQSNMPPLFQRNRIEDDPVGGTSRSIDQAGTAALPPARKDR